MLTEFLENVLGIQDAHGIEFQRMRRLGKPRKENDKDRVVIARFLRYKDRERVFKCGRRLKATEYKMNEDLPKEIHEKTSNRETKESQKGWKTSLF